MAPELADIQETGLRGQLVDYWRGQLQSWPPALVWEGLQRLSAEALADLQVGPAQAIQEMRELQALILNRSRLRLWLMGDRRLLQQARPHVEALVRSFPLRDVEAPRCRRDAGRVAETSPPSSGAGHRLSRLCGVRP